MIRVAIVEDEIESAELLEKYLIQYGKEENIVFQITHYNSALSFLYAYKSDFDLIFMDINMPHMNGMEASVELRKIDQTVVLIFVTNMLQYAIKGYEVDALDFIVKPVKYFSFAIKMNKAVKRISNHEEHEIYIKASDNCVTRIKLSHLKYIEVEGHKLTYHTEDGNFVVYGSLKNVENELCRYNFAKCYKSYLVNLRHVTAIKGYTVVVGGDELLIGHPNKKKFVKALNDYRGGGKNV